MPLTGYMKIPDIAGESKRADHEDEIDFHGIDWDVARDSSQLIGRGRRRSRAVASPVEVLKFYDASSPYLALAVAQGKSFDEIVLSVRKDSGDAHLDYLVITLTNCMISGYQMTNQGLEDPQEQIGERVEIEFEKINIKYTVQADDHSAGDEHEIEYDIAAGA
ncbi:hypothetical protein PEL8287_01940 [Roseovarius litorisediminis]|uniref:Major exported protein n=1 Tax=Roseovarius litorisediminis TaxID=1312363 RepID=A0A1Y5SF46_9RHOB|nr:type VI secretion system tube protein Hcp [Roseovarius litorisediminis]SLN39374.1 hypothetical protein PEL8287_01940 [Roseovarius litorisediminis]